MKLLRCHNMIPNYKWYVQSDHLVMPDALFFGTRKQCEAYIREHSKACAEYDRGKGSHVYNSQSKLAVARLKAKEPLP